MVSYDHGGGYLNLSWPPVGAPVLNGPQREDPHWSHFDNSVNAVSFGFVATAILISMFLIMAIFERFLRPTSSGTFHSDLESQMRFNPKLGHSSPKMTVYANGVSVVMPGDNIPTFIAHPAPVPCPAESVSCLHQRQIEPVSTPLTHSTPTPTPAPEN